MRPLTLVLLLATTMAVGAASAACGVERLDPLQPVSAASTNAGDAGLASANSADPGGTNTTGSGAGTGAVTGLPCDVEQLFENRCISCHLGPTPPPLLTYEDLIAPAPDAPSKSMAQASLERVSGTGSPMPPPPAEAPTSDEIQTLRAWVTAGTPRGGVCTAASDAGTAAPPDYATPVVCTSNVTAKGGNDGSSTMRPGVACINCHTQEGGPSFKIAGTVYPTAHEPDNCDGVANGVTVVVTDANGTVTNLSVNGVGNFYSRAQVVAPFHVKVTSGNRERAMSASLTAGDCNSCHTVNGANGAPGRIMAP